METLRLSQGLEVHSDGERPAMKKAESVEPFPKGGRVGKEATVSPIGDEKIGRRF